MSRSSQKRVLITNRGEILGRVAKTLSLENYVVYAYADKHQNPEEYAYLRPYVSEFIEIEDLDNSFFLDADKHLKMAKRYKIDAIHPGYGYLSESASFAKKIVENGLVWIGPHHEAIEVMASKFRARKVAEKLEIPMVPCFSGLNSKNIDEKMADLKDFANKAQYPLMAKAALGGGGKGIRIVANESELKNGCDRAASEGQSFFADDTLLVEKLIVGPRHIEVQLACDKKGNIFTLSDRDCSLQRRQQKILEEAPACFLKDSTKEKLHDYAKRLAKEVSYDSLGTVEFLVDKKENIYFLEMNTRLQVEHCVTEEVMGIDLVSWQTKSAFGGDLKQNYDTQISKPRGHSIEVRLYGENPAQDFRPSPGKIQSFLHTEEQGLRWEKIFFRSYDISPGFDPMFAKLVIHAADRKSCFEKLSRVLKNTSILGPENNTGFLYFIAHRYGNEVFSTDFISKNKEGLFKDFHSHLENKSQILESVKDLTKQIFRQNENRQEELFWSDKSQLRSEWKQIKWRYLQRYRNSFKNEVFAYALSSDHEDLGTLQYAKVSPSSDVYESVFSSEGQHYPFLVSLGEKKAKSKKTQNLKSSGEIISPVTGKIFRILVEDGQEVEQGQSCFVLESMKLEFELKASKKGVIKFATIGGDRVLNIGDFLSESQLIASVT